MLKIMVNGYNGRMGQEVVRAIEQIDDIELICGYDIEAKENSKYKVYTNYLEIIERPDVIIDFTVPIASFKLLEYAQKNNIPTVIATTGFTQEDKEKIKEYSKDMPIFQANNMSVDINLMCKLVGQITKKLYDTDIEIVETHHNRKIDSPSGTALMLADSINQAKDGKMKYEFDRHSKKEKRSKDEIGFSSIRGGNIVGEHSVMFFGENESFEIKHTSYSRKVFAEGAIRAAKFIINKKSGFYNMDDLIKED